MRQRELAAAAELFREMHGRLSQVIASEARRERRSGLLLPNAWDAASARIFEEAGFPAIATTSAGIAWARGLRDGERIGRDAMAREIASIAAVVHCPVTADIEAGYGPAPSDVAATVEAIIDAGAIGINLEDSTGRPGDEPLFGIRDQVARLEAARAAGERRRVPIVINARTDAFLLGLGGDTEQRLAMTIERGRAYLQAGADVVFIPGLVDPGLVRHLAAGIDGPISVLFRPGGPAVDGLFAAGACRVSLGSSAMQATLGALRELARDLREHGTFVPGARDTFDYVDAQALFAP